ncbi:MAG: SDR family oxidoreductase [Proteobacteria bacterium]|nr:SDR family oxidoreductase [Pseudomonadota bacterium]
MADRDFHDKVVLVTGASRGIGRAIAREFAERGATIAVHYHRSDAGARETVTALPGSAHRAFRADIAQPSSVSTLVDDVVRTMGSIDVLVNNAGFYEAHPIVDTSYEDWQEAWQRTLAINLLGPTNLIHCVVPHMIGNGGGRIVNISSRGAFRGEPEGPAYGASKAGLNAMGQSLAKALAPHSVYVCTVAPGFVETEMARPILSGPSGDALRGEIPFGRIARPEEVALTAVFLALPGTEYLTGCIVDVNGASYLRT